MSARGLCNFCKKDKERHHEGSLFSARNLMDPGRVPIELSQLTNPESLLIARVHPTMSVYRVKGQQYKYGGNVINFVQDVNVIASVLPHKPKDLSAVLIIKRTGMNSNKEFVVRREYVREALLWLEKNHTYYHGISISDGNINELPENGIPDDLPGMGGNEDQQRSDSLFGEQSNEDGYDGPPELQDQSFHINEFETVGTIGAIVQPDQQRCIIRALESAEVDQTIADMSFTGEVIDEFTTKRYITMAFPTLFPYGTADLLQLRPRKVRECQYFQYLMKYKDGRFVRDSRFRYFALNSLTRWRALSLGSVYVNNSPQDGNEKAGV
ncbi:uncharacterized protein LOC113359778 [Papaver somniferum]|uniref:uncharacterized protein LOC113359778 n=1 Tax=Papaver somniferum TaxID=3469 RepID=UPI000E6FCEC3|nr:uncharacterized protein LOC113359778 [Papaver somniferum]